MTLLQWKVWCCGSLNVLFLLCHIALSEAACESKVFFLSASSEQSISSIVVLEAMSQNRPRYKLQRLYTQNWPNTPNRAWNICRSVYALRACDIILHTSLHFNWTPLNTSKLAIIIQNTLAPAHLDKYPSSRSWCSESGMKSCRYRVKSFSSSSE